MAKKRKRRQTKKYVPRAKSLPEFRVRGNVVYKRIGRLYEVFTISRTPEVAEEFLR